MAPLLQAVPKMIRYWDQVSLMALWHLPGLHSTAQLPKLACPFLGMGLRLWLPVGVPAAIG
jgi:hypothetical protein